MILPIPTPVGVAEDAVAFVDLSGAADLFARLDALFPVMLEPGDGAEQVAAGRRVLAGPPGRRVQRVVRATAGRLRAARSGAAPARAGVGPAARLRRLRLLRVRAARAGGAAAGAGHSAAGAEARGAGCPRGPSDGLRVPAPRPGRSSSDRARHDGAVHAKATFDHTLYLQAPEAEAGAIDWAWEVSSSVAGRAARDAEAMVAADAHVFRRKLRGTLPNRDQVIAVDAEARRTRIVGPCAVQLDEPWHAADAALLDATMASRRRRRRWASWPGRSTRTCRCRPSASSCRRGCPQGSSCTPARA